MALTIGSNIASLKAQGRLAFSNEAIGTVFERLSSGQRINRASDDAAGLAIAESLRKDQRVFTQGVRNFNDGVSLLNIADGALYQLSGITTRLVELAEQAANGVLGYEQRKSLDEEAQALKAEYFRISQSAEFNGTKLFDGSLGQLRLQGGFGVDGGIASGIGGAIGNGEFTLASVFTSGASTPEGIELGDVDGDGDLDIAAGGGFSLRVLFNDGNGNFTDQITFSESDTDTVVLGDVNGDGNLDLVSVSDDPDIIVRFGDGTGNFGERSTFSTGLNFVYGVELIDVNDDGIEDALTAGQAGGVGYVSVHLGAGDGTFGNTTTYTAESGLSINVKAGDINGDGVLDLITDGRDGTSNGYITARIGLGDGTFGTATSYSTGGQTATGLAISDVNDDGFTDVVTVSGDGYATLHFGAGDGSLTYSASFYANDPAGNMDGVELADINGDGIEDLVTTGSSGGILSLSTLIGDGNGTFSDLSTYLNSTNQWGDPLDIGDVNQDGVLDIIVSGRQGVFLTYLGDSVDGVSPIQDFSLDTLAGARQALPMLQQKLDQIATQRGEIGAFQSRLETGTRVLQVSAENIGAAESQIRDADVADETSKLVRLNILQQATAGVLAQANQQPALALNLLINA